MVGAGLPAARPPPCRLPTPSGRELKNRCQPFRRHRPLGKCDHRKLAAMSRPEEEYREFVGSRAASLHRTAYLLCGDWHLASDLVQETFVHAFRHWRRVQRADNQNAYVKRILINEFNRHWQRYSGLPGRGGTDHPEFAIPDVSDEVASRADLLRALLALPARQRATVVLRYLEGMSERETAAVMRCSEGTVKSQTARALNTLSGCLQHKESPL